MAIPPYILGPNPWAQMMAQQQAHAQLAAAQAHAQAAHAQAAAQAQVKGRMIIENSRLCIVLLQLHLIFVPRLPMLLLRLTCKHRLLIS